ncbi:MAG TPA: hypothetical protein VFM05_02530 [Candidatus Saccharimonadales bacterium]|nr:hypothetical protein [Candidatus Saccharimonadales bacterium]
MLVKFLSFCATILGTARYKALFLSCLTLGVALSGITAVALMHGSSGSNGVSVTVKEEDNASQTNGFTPQLGGARKQTPKETEQQPSSSATPSAPENTVSKQPAATPKTPAPSPEITLNLTEVKLVGEDAKTVIASTSDVSKVSWSISLLEQPAGLHLVPLTDPQQNSFSFQIKADTDTVHGTYSLVVSAKDAARNLDISKKVIITVQ